MYFINRSLVLAVMVAFSGCLSNVKEHEQRQATLEEMIACPPERPLVCTMVHDPVCGVYQDGTTWDYSSKCMACTRQVIIGYIPGTCSSRLKSKSD